LHVESQQGATVVAAVRTDVDVAAAAEVGGSGAPVLQPAVEVGALLAQARIARVLDVEDARVDRDRPAPASLPQPLRVELHLDADAALRRLDAQRRRARRDAGFARRVIDEG